MKKTTTKKRPSKRDEGPKHRGMGRGMGPRDGSGPNPDCSLKKKRVK